MTIRAPRLASVKMPLRVPSHGGVPGRRRWVRTAALAAALLVAFVSTNGSYPWRSFAEPYGAAENGDPSRPARQLVAGSPPVAAASNAASEACISQLRDDGAWIRLDDLRGGAVYQKLQSDPALAPQDIWWAEKGAPGRVLVPASTREGLRLYTVSGDATDPTVWYTVREPGQTPLHDTVSLHRISLLSEFPELVIPDIGGFEVAPMLVALSGDWLLVSNADSTGSWFELHTSDGVPVPWQTNPHPASDYTMKTVYGVLSPDGSYLASVEAPDAEPWTVVVRTVSSGSVIDQWPVLLPDDLRMVSTTATFDGFEFLGESGRGELHCVEGGWPAA